MRHRKKQKVPFINAIPVHLPPTRIESTKSIGKRKADSISDSTAESSVKHTTTEIVLLLEAEMNIRLTKKITACLPDGGSLKECMTLETIERGSVSKAEIKVGFKSNTIANYIKNCSKANINYWRDYVKSQFDTIAKKNKANIDSNPNSPAASPSTSTRASASALPKASASISCLGTCAEKRDPQELP